MDVIETTATAETLAGRIETMIATGRIGGARSLLAALQRLEPDPVRYAELATRIALADRRFDEARTVLDDAIAAAPAHAGLRKLRARLLAEQDDPAAAAQDAAEAVILDPHDPAAKALLGLVLLEVGQAADARACLTESVRAAPHNPSFRTGLAAAEEACGQADAAAATLADGIAINPGRIELRSAAILLSVRRLDFTAAIAQAEAARLAGIADACVFGLKGHALSSLGRHAEAGEAYREALKLGPDDPYVRHMVASAGFLPGGSEAPLDYLRAIFDGYAERFDSHLIGLGYRIPGLLRSALLDRFTTDDFANPIGPVLDLGCGTGLVAVVLNDLPFGPITGVDLSEQMLAKAQDKKLYANLHHAEIGEFLLQDQRRWRIVLAADVLCYTGALSAMFGAVFARLQDGGVFLFSVEHLADAGQDWALGPQGRYAHSPAYIETTALAAGFSVRVLEESVLRNEANQPVVGLICVLERPNV